MTSKIILITVFILLIIYTAVPSGWKHIYTAYRFNSARSQIIIPAAGIHPEDLEDTFGVYRSADRSHEGIDLFASRGTEVLNSCEGKVIYIGRDVYGGNTIRILGKDNRIYYYAHLDHYAEIKEGQSVSQGQVIAYVGNTGNALETMPHLHFEIMEIRWLFPMITANINPYSVLTKQSAGQN